MTRCELLLLKEAIKKEHDYYHLISGIDLPIKSNEFIDDFFEKNKGKNFIATIDNLQPSIYERIKYYHFFAELMQNPHRRNLFNRIFVALDRISICIQKLFKINRIKANNLDIRKGSQWFSITNSFAKYICENEEYINRNFKYSLIADELFCQTIAYQSKFRNSIINNSLRYIDWTRGLTRPYTFRKEDYKSLMESDKLWARKFSEKVDSEIVVNIFKTLKTEEVHAN